MTMWKDLDPSKITSKVCLQCASCCKHTSHYTESKERYAVNKVEYLMAMFNKPREDFRIETNNKVWNIHVTWKCAQLNPDNTCKIYQSRPNTCERFNCFVSANIDKRLPENYENIKKYVDRQ